MEVLGGDFYESDVWTEFYIYQDGNAFYLRRTIGLFWPLKCDIYGRVLSRPCSMTTVYKAGFSTPDDLYNLVTKIITKYPVLTTFKILKIIKKKHLQFFCNFENFKSC